MPPFAGATTNRRRALGERESLRGECPDDIEPLTWEHAIQQPEGPGSQLDRVGQRELFARNAADEAAAADLAAGLAAAIPLAKLKPGRGGGLAGQQIAEDDAVATQKQASPEGGSFRLVNRLLLR